MIRNYDLFIFFPKFLKIPIFFVITAFLCAKFSYLLTLMQVGYVLNPVISIAFVADKNTLGTFFKVKMRFEKHYNFFVSHPVGKEYLGMPELF